MLRKILPLLTFCATLAVSAAAHAETVLITFGGTAPGSFSFDSTQFTLASGAYNYGSSSLITALDGEAISSFSFAQTPSATIPDFSTEGNVDGSVIDAYFYGPALAGSGASPVFTPGTYDFDKVLVYVDGALSTDELGENVTISAGGVGVGAVPEPSSFLLLGTGLAGVGGAIRRRIKRS